MTNVITIDELEITNFKGVKGPARFLFPNHVNNVFGANETGKTTLADAWNWLLNGKDSLEREKFNIKNTVDLSLNKADHDVRAVLTVNGEKMKLRKVLTENWVKPMGQTEKVLKGNDTAYWINDVPVKAGEYNKQIAEVLDERLIKVLTNPLYFNRLNWADRRNILFDMAGSISDNEIAKDRPEFVALLASLNNKSLIAYKTQIASEKALLKKSLIDIPGRISELKRGLPEPENLEKINEQIAALKTEIAGIDEQITNKSNAFNQANNAATEEQNKIHKLETDISTISHRLRTERQTEEQNKNLARNAAKNKITGIEADIASKSNLLKSTEERVTTLTNQKAQTLQEWHDVNGTKPKFDDGAFCCPTCKRELEPGDVDAKKTELITAFNRDKSNKLDALEKKGGEFVTQIKDAQTLIGTLTTAIETLKTDLAAAQTAANEQPQETDQQSIESVIENNAEITAIKSQIEQIKAGKGEAPVLDVKELREQREAKNNEVIGLNQKITVQNELERKNTRVKELEKEENELNQKIADLDNVEFTIQAFNKEKVEETERRINGLFKYVTFKMYDYTLEGNPVDTCETMYNGVPFSDLNTAHKIWAGLDIINALSKHYGIIAPIFLDNRESTTNIPETESQIINLIVSPEHTVLTVE